MVKALVFKGEKKLKKRKRTETLNDAGDARLAASPSSLKKNEMATDDDDSWVTAHSMDEIVGPTIIILSTSPVTCLASDANGKKLKKTKFKDSIISIMDCKYLA